MSFDPRTRLPLLPSARKLKPTDNSSQVLGDRSTEALELESPPSSNNPSDRTDNDAKYSSSSPNNASNGNGNDNDDDTNKKFLVPAKTTLESAERDGIVVEAKLKLRNDHLKEFSSVPPLPTSITTAMTLHFISTTTSFLNTFAVSADEKLERCGKRIRDLDVKMGLLESKLDSVQVVEREKNNRG